MEVRVLDIQQAHKFSAITYNDYAKAGDAQIRGWPSKVESKEIVKIEVEA